MQLTMLKESFFFLHSYKYGHLKRNFFCGTNVEDIEDAAFPVFGFCQDHSVLVWHTLFWSYNSWRLFQASAPLKQKYALGAIELNSLNWLAGLSQEKQFLFVVHKKLCSEAGRRHLRRFVSVERFLSSLGQVGRTWHGQLMTGIWRIFWLSKQTCLSFVPSAT